LDTSTTTSIQKYKIGRVVSDKMQKTVVVAVENQRRHPIYRRLMKRTVRFKAHDETNICKMGDIVRIVETRPLSREKRWRVAEIMERADTVEAIDDQIA
jgi:small subunit ribosomal protein S17